MDLDSYYASQLSASSLKFAKTVVYVTQPVLVLFLLNHVDSVLIF